MKVFESLDTTYSASEPCAMTVGSFDGVHLGHQALLAHIRSKIGPKGTLCVVTFSNHPSQVLPHRESLPQILSKQLKINSLEKAGVDVVFCVEFTSALASMPYDEFLKKLHEACPFSLLVLGEGATLGKKREGTQEKVEALGKELGYSAEYIQKRKKGEVPISSNRIRQCILQGKLHEAIELLGRPLTIEAYITTGGIQLPKNLCIPPDGIYPISVMQENKEFHTTVCIENQHVKIKVPIECGNIVIVFHS